MRPSYCFPLWQNHLKAHEPKSRAAACMAWSCLAASLPGQRPQRNLGVWSSCLRTEAISRLLDPAEFKVYHMPQLPMGMESSLLERQIILHPPLLTYTEPFSFISSPSCIIPATSYSLEIALFNIFLHFDCYGIF